MSRPLRVLLADDKAKSLDGLRRLVESVSDLVLVGVADKVPDVIPRLQETKPDLLILDLRWHSSDVAGENLLESIHQARIPVKIIIHTAYPNLLLNNLKVSSYANSAVVSSYFSRDDLVYQISKLFPLPHPQNDKTKELQHTLIIFGLALLACLAGVAFIIYLLGRESAQFAVGAAVVMFVALLACVFFVAKQLTKKDFMELLNMLFETVKPMKDG